MTEMDREKMAGHIGYEWAMLLGAAESDWNDPGLKNKTPPYPITPRAIANECARTELVLLHGRALFHFLFVYNKAQFPDALNALDFLEPPESGQWEKDARDANRKRPNGRALRLCPKMTADRDRANKRIFHLSVERESLPLGWEYPVVVRELTLAFREFHHDLKAPRRELLIRGMRTRWPTLDIFESPSTWPDWRRENFPSP